MVGIVRISVFDLTEVIIISTYGARKIRAIVHPEIVKVTFRPVIFLWDFLFSTVVIMSHPSNVKL